MTSLFLAGLLTVGAALAPPDALEVRAGTEANDANEANGSHGMPEARRATDEPPARFAFGIGLGVDGKPYRGYDERARGMPVLVCDNRWLAVRGTTVDWKAAGGALSWCLRARYTDDGYEASDAQVLAGMDERKGGFWLGPALVWRTGIATLSAEALADISGRSDGRRTRIALDRTLHAGVWSSLPAPVLMARQAFRHAGAGKPHRRPARLRTPP